LASVGVGGIKIIGSILSSTLDTKQPIEESY
jgi:hypothetical protein